MSDSCAVFVDYYEILEISPNANSDTVERVFRYLAKRYHPDTSCAADVSKFNQLVEAFETLRNPVLRAAYDAEYAANKAQEKQLARDTSRIGDDVEERTQLLSLFYAKRRRSMNQPGIGVSTLESIVEYPVEVLDFHIWYFREKGWIEREECGLLSITAEGVDRIEQNQNATIQTPQPKITFDVEAQHAAHDNFDDRTRRIRDRISRVIGRDSNPSRNSGLSVE